ncbi:ATP synthase F1 subunit gamma [Acidobacteriota bacterium]
MAENLQDLRRRINSIKNTRKITQAMKTVSAAKLGRSVSKLKRVRPMMEKIEEMLERVSEDKGIGDHPFLQDRQSGDTIIVAVSSDKGLCGAFNSHIIERAEELFEGVEEEGEHPALITIGNKIYKYFEKRNYPINRYYDSLMSDLDYPDVKALSAFLQEIYLDESKNIKKIEFVYTGFRSASRQEITISTLFPIQDQLERDKVSHESEEDGFIFEPSVEVLFKALLPRYIDSLIYRVLLESSASENAARMSAMELATSNAEDMIRDLTLTLNKLRQASITNELLEIITATEALKK